MHLVTDSLLVPGTLWTFPALDPDSAISHWCLQWRSGIYREHSHVRGTYLTESAIVSRCGQWGSRRNIRVHALCTSIFFKKENAIKTSDPNSELQILALILLILPPYAFSFYLKMLHWAKLFNALFCSLQTE